VSTIKVDTYLTRGGASEIAIDKLKGASSASSISVVAEGGTNTTNLQGGLSKAWIAGDNSSGSISVTDSLNFSSSTDVTAGKSTISFSNNMATAKGYSIAGANADGSDQTAYQYQSQPLQDGSVATASIALVHSYVTSNASGMGDYAYWSYSIHGDLA